MYMNTGYLKPISYGFKTKVAHCLQEVAVLTAFPAIQSYQPTVQGDAWIIRLSISLLVRHFHFDNVDNETIVPAGNIVLYRPKELQKYEYYGDVVNGASILDSFTGNNVKNILRNMDSRIRACISGRNLYGIRTDFHATSIESALPR